MSIMFRQNTIDIFRRMAPVAQGAHTRQRILISSKIAYIYVNGNSGIYVMNIMAHISITAGFKSDVNMRYDY